MKKGSMKCKFMVVIMFLLITLLLGNVEGRPNRLQKEVKIQGRVIDREGKPVKGSQIVLFPAKQINKVFYPSVGHLIEFYESDENGDFKIIYSFGSYKHFVFYVTNPLPKGYLNVVYPPFFSLPEDKYSRHIALNNKKSIFLSDVPITVYYGVVEIDIRKSNNEPFFQSLQSESLAYVLKDKDNIIDNGLLLGDSPFIKDSVFKLLLPEGSWNLDFEISKGSNLTILSTHVDITDVSKTTKIFLMTKE